MSNASTVDCEYIDCQSHVFAPELIEIMERRSSPPCIYERDGSKFLVVQNWHRPMVEKALDLPAKLADMDRLRIGMAALSTNDPGPEQFGEEGPYIARLVHDFLADVARQHPGRFFLLATLPLTNVHASIKELDRCVHELGMKGVLLYSNIAGKFPDEPEFAPLFAAAEEMDIPVLLHPPCPVTFEATKDYNLTGGLGLMFDTTIALCRLILSGVFDRHPRLKLVCPHVGGTLPYLIGRIDHQVCVLKRVPVKLKKRPSEYLKENVFLDTVNVLPSVIQFGIDFVGPDRMLFATDHPWVEADISVRNVQSLGLSDENKAKIFRENARKLFKL